MTQRRAVAIHGVIVLAALLASGAGPVARSTTPTREDLLGVWRMCYEPGFAGVSEIDNGYLMFFPDGTFARMTDTATSRIAETGTYEITPFGVRLRADRRQGLGESDVAGSHFAPWDLRYDPDRPVVFASADPDRPAFAPVLMPGENANYGFAKVL